MPAAEPSRGLPSFGRYQTLFRIAAGGMAEVYAARVGGLAEFTKVVAIKRMLPHLAAEEQFVDMFLDEARVAANISSPNVVQTIELGQADDGALYLVMEFVIGVTLSTILRNEIRRNGKVPIPMALEIVRQAARGLDDAHNARTPTGTFLGIVHRDISPQNILVDIDGRARVTDFGIARAMLRRSATNTGQLKGKFAYFSPEQAAGSELDRRSDVFSLGIVAWETLTCRRLFPSDENPLATLERVKNEALRTPSQLRADVPAEVSEVVMRALDRDPDKRFASCADFEHALAESCRDALKAPTRKELATYVRDAAGESLTALQSQLEHALAGADAPTLVGASILALQHPNADLKTQELVSEVRARLDDAQTTVRSQSIPPGALGGTTHSQVSETMRLRPATPGLAAPWIALLIATGALTLLIGILVGRSLGKEDTRESTRDAVPFVPVARPAAERAPDVSSIGASPTSTHPVANAAPTTALPVPISPDAIERATPARLRSPLPARRTVPNGASVQAAVQVAQPLVTIRENTSTSRPDDPPRPPRTAPQEGQSSGPRTSGSRLFVPVDVFDQQARGSRTP